MTDRLVDGRHDSQANASRYRFANAQFDLSAHRYTLCSDSSQLWKDLPLFTYGYARKQKLVTENLKHRSQAHVQSLLQLSSTNATYQKNALVRN